MGYKRVYTVLCAIGIAVGCVVWIVVARWCRQDIYIGCGCKMSGNKMVYAVLPRFGFSIVKYAGGIENILHHSPIKT